MAEVDNIIIKVAAKLAFKLDKASDKTLPQDISDVVKLHAKIAAGLAVIPLPGGDFIAAVANIWTMYVRINNKLGIKFSDDKLKTIASGVAANLAQVFLGRAAIGAIVKIFPGIGTLAGAVIDGVMLYTLTITSAYIYMKALVAMAEFEGRDFSNVDKETHVADFINHIMDDDSADIKDVMKDAKQSYKKEDMSDAAELAKQATKENNG